MKMHKKIYTKVLSGRNWQKPVFPQCFNHAIETTEMAEICQPQSQKLTTLDEWPLCQ